MVKKGFSYLTSRFLKVAAVAALLTGSVVAPEAQAAIDQTMPASIPAEIVADWEAQAKEKNETAESIKASLPADLQAKCDGTLKSACHWRRVDRMSQYPHLEKIMFAKHHNIGGTAVGFWVNLGTGSNITADSRFAAKGSLCLLQFTDYYSSFKEILTKTNAAIKDPCISLDGKKVVFAMSGSSNNSGWRIYEMKIDDPSSVKQLTFNPDGITVSDFEPCYLPNGDIMFSSSRCFGVIDCGWQATTNMFIMDSVGNHIRRVGYDQVHTCNPQLCPDGTVLYTRWEYNDRDVSNVMGLFSMNPDGCRQTEVYGNQTTWPQTFIMGRPVPGKKNLFFAVASGHHGEYSGEVFICDNSKNTNGVDGVKMISPPRPTETRDKNDTWAMGGVWRNSVDPYPLDEEWYLVGYREESKVTSFNDGVSTGKYRIYLKSVDGKSRELLAWADQSLHTPVVVAPFKAIWGTDPFPIAQQTNYNDSMGTFTMNDVYYGPGMKDIKKGEAKSLRVIALKYRIMGACDQGFGGMLSGTPPSGVVFSAPTINPVSTGGCSWEAKEVLGEAKIYPDGSASFQVPARTPVYFEVIDSNGCMIAGMRSWATLMPGETFACYGCHENKSEAPPTAPTFLAGDGKPQKLDTPLGIENKGFDYKEMVQPILEKHCVSCHKSGHTSGFDLTGALVSNSGAKKSFTQSYVSLTKGLKGANTPGVGVTASNKAICITSIFSQPEQMPPRSYGSSQSGMIKNLLKGHKEVKITAQEIKILACWIDLEAPHAGSYDAYASSSDAQKYKALEATAQKWYDVEHKNILELAALQKTGLNPNIYSDIQMIAPAKSVGIRYLPAERALILNIAGKGKLMLVDLRGRVISQCNLSDKHVSGATVSLPATMSNGIYLARFEGVNGVEESKISVTK